MLLRYCTSYYLPSINGDNYHVAIFNRVGEHFLDAARSLRFIICNECRAICMKAAAPFAFGFVYLWPPSANPNPH